MKEWSRYQEDIHTWKSAMMPADINTPRGEFDRSIEEVNELDEAINKGNHELIGEEAVDVIVRMIGIATIVGCNVDQLLDKKIKQTTQQKYPAAVIQANMDLGDTWPQAMKRQKVIWQAKKGLNPSL